MAEPTRFVVAVVDDDHRTLESLADLLEAEGYDVRLYSSATTVWTRGGLSEIDCLISDIGMPEMNGFELRRLALSERPELPVILITGRPELRAQYPRSSNVIATLKSRLTVSGCWQPSARRWREHVRRERPDRPNLIAACLRGELRRQRKRNTECCPGVVVRGCPDSAAMRLNDRARNR